ncbi:MAG: hypothetical protein JNL63_08210, partial [Bacteroidia bacterium]|nr:hypothetical protein [Bacteroidia bacterium]
TLRFAVYDKDENFFIEIPSKKIKVNASNELLSTLEKIPGVGFKLN